MSTLGQAYKSKEKGDTSITTSKGYMVAVEKLFIEDGFNVRDVTDEKGQESVAYFADAYAACEYVPPLVVKYNADRDQFQIIDGHHRYMGALKAGVARLSVDDFKGSLEDAIAFMVTSSQGRQLSAVERGEAYIRLRAFGYTMDEIAKKCSRSKADVVNHLNMMEQDKDTIQAVADGIITMNEVNEVTRANPLKGNAIIKTAVENAKEKVAPAKTIAQDILGDIPQATETTKKPTKPKKAKVSAADLGRWTNTMSKRLCQLTYDPDVNHDDNGIKAEKADLISSYAKHLELKG